jgi:predicted transposase/invertase (TIGR01784 family)
MSKPLYDQNMKYKWDNENVMEYAVTTAKAEGEHKKALEVALKMKKEGFSIDQIAKFTDLSAEEIEQL